MGTREERKKAVEHSKTKDQKIMLGQQLIEGGADFAEQVSSSLEHHQIDTVKATNIAGRRVQDKANLQRRILVEDERASRLTRTKLTLAAIQEEALRTKPKNDVTFTFDSTVIQWRESVEKMS